MNIITLFCEIDDFFLAYEKWVSTQCLPETPPLETRGRPRQLHPSEVMTLLIAFHQSNYRTLKHFYLKHVCVYWGDEFPHLVSYSRFVRLQSEVLTLLVSYLSTTLGDCSGVSFVDSTRRPRVCDNRRISSHRVFADVAECSKTSMGWFYGFKLHLAINEKGEVLDVALTPGNIDDRKPLRKFAERLHGSLYADRGYISKDLREALGAQYLSTAYLSTLKEHGIEISLARRGHPWENGYAERLIRTLKEEEVHLNDYEDITEARQRIGQFITQVYHQKRPHSALGYLTPLEFQRQTFS